MSITVSTGDEVWVAAEWIYQTLTADVVPGGLVPPTSPLVTGIFADMAPRDQPFPYITYTLQSAPATLGVGADTIWVDCLYQVQVVNNDWSLGPVHAINKRFHLLLHKKSGSVADGIVHDCVRERVVTRVDAVEGVTHRYYGGLYRLHVQSS